jgi:hypothetical protein
LGSSCRKIANKNSSTERGAERLMKNWVRNWVV